jgi:hypothetical protein
MMTITSQLRPILLLIGILSISILRTTGAAPSLQEGCAPIFAAADSNHDRTLDRSEFASAANNFAGDRHLDSNIFDSRSSETDMSTQVIEGRPPTSYAFCMVAMTMSDNSNNADGQMDSAEYFKFVNIMSSQDFYCIGQFADLPLALRDSYASHDANGGGLPIFGARPVDNASKEQEQVLRDFCIATNLFIRESSTGFCGEPTPAPVPAPPSSTSRPTFSILQCVLSLAEADADGDSFVSRVEYITFVYELSGDNNIFAGVIFNELPFVLQNNFNELAVNNQRIDASGSKVGSIPTSEQLEFLRRVCEETTAAISFVLAAVPTTPGPTLVTPGPTELPPTTLPSVATLGPTDLSTTSAPTSGFPTATPTVSADEFEVTSKFVISNTVGITAFDMTPLFRERVKLDDAYNRLAQDAADDVFGTGVSGRRTRRLRRRLLVEYVLQSGRTSTYLDIACPPTASDSALCQTVGAAFSIKATSDEDILPILATVKEAVDALILEGQLEAFLKELNSDLFVESPITPTTPTSKATTTSTTTIVAATVGAVGGIFLLGVIFYLWGGGKGTGVPKDYKHINDTNVCYDTTGLISTHSNVESLEGDDHLPGQEHQYETANVDPVGNASPAPIPPNAALEQDPKQPFMPVFDGSETEVQAPLEAAATRANAPVTEQATPPRETSAARNTAIAATAGAATGTAVAGIIGAAPVQEGSEFYREFDLNSSGSGSSSGDSDSNSSSSGSDGDSDTDSESEAEE